MKNNKLTARNKRKSINLALWTAAWVLTIALVSFGYKFCYQSPVISIITISVNLLIGIGMIIANMKYLNGLDELQRKISLEAMGITLGVTLVVGLGYSMLDTTNVISNDAEISYLVIVMGLTYIVATVINNIKYK
ncbi:hypothetical protein [Christiangramia crocea]|uniref:Uncharacterized protein n=1 Tax=Christiangramia crocea TaxID=2904124 RepID=A0A9X1UV48_9FLAO|nr:hypothetical protein [Gramella crocea]MCG9970615.1 hypothetical protein [Gramella crocea]